MIFHLIVKHNGQDNTSLNEDDVNKVLTIPSFYSDEDQTLVSHNIKELLVNGGYEPSETLIDFVNVCLAAYTIDQLISREAYGHLRWSRFFKLYVPVLDLGTWNFAKSEIEDCLSFLSGDKWEIVFRSREAIHENYQRTDSEIEKVSLFSGGLDSFIGAVDLLEQHEKIAFVSHHKGGGGGEMSIQENLITQLSTHYASKDMKSFNFYVQPNQNENSYGGENTQRARSIIFIALGLVVANSIGENTNLLIPENGLISLNVPLTKTRYGSYSTRTTHPNFLNHIRNILASLGISNALFNPYHFKTKGEMITESRNRTIVEQLAYNTVSCSKPGHDRRWKKRDEIHCGTCVPCIIRRASLYKAEIDRFQDNYVLDVVTNPVGENIRAFKIALARFSSNYGNKIFELLKSGPIPCNNDELTEYISVYERGMNEVKSFLNQD